MPLKTERIQRDDGETLNN